MSNEYDEAVLCGFVWCHGKEDFSAWEVEITKQDQESIEKILSKYAIKGTSERNCYNSRFSDVFCDCYANASGRKHWTDYLPTDAYERLCECRNVKNDIPVLVNARYAWLQSREQSKHFTKEDALVYVLELLDCNSQWKLTELDKETYDALCR